MSGELKEAVRHEVELRQLLDEQYQVVEAYCNAQTLLYNAIHSKDPLQYQSLRLQGEHPPVGVTVDEALRSYSDAISALRCNLRALREVHLKLPRNAMHLVEDHLNQMDDIIAWLGGQEPLVHPNGVPRRVAINTDTFTLALSATRASIRVVKDALPQS